MRDARLLGVEKDTEKRYASQRSWEFDVTEQGWRYHMSNIMAAIGLEQLKRFDEFAEIRRARALFYDELFKNCSRICPLPRDYNTVVPHIYVVRIPGLKSRKELQHKLMEHGVQTGIHYQPNHWHSLYHDQDAAPLPVTESVYSELITLPLHPDLREDDVIFVASLLKRYCE